MSAAHEKAARALAATYARQYLPADLDAAPQHVQAAVTRSAAIAGANLGDVYAAHRAAHNAHADELNSPAGIAARARKLRRG